MALIEFNLFSILEQRTFKHLQIAEEQRRLQKLSDALTDALHSMFSSVFDASCECDEKGCVLNSSPHLRDLLGVTEQDLAGVDIATLAVSEHESQRISAFLSQCLQIGSAQKNQPAGKMQTAL